MKNGEITIKRLLMSCLNILFKQLEFDVLPKTKTSKTVAIQNVLCDNVCTEN